MPRLNSPAIPPHKREHIRARDLAMEQPGEWVELSGDWAVSVASQINAGRYGYDPDLFRACSRRLKSNPKRAKIFVTYIGDDDS